MSQFTEQCLYLSNKHAKKHILPSLQNFLLILNFSSNILLYTGKVICDLQVVPNYQT